MQTADLTGQRFGRLTVVGKDTSDPSNEKRKRYWLCKCDCGKLVSVRIDHLIHGATRSCGCLMKEINSEIHSIDLTGKTFGRLTVLGPSKNKRASGDKLWVCQCSCSKHAIVEVITSNLTRGNTTSCGCYHKERTSEIHAKWKTADEQRLMNIYNSMVQRCNNPNFAEFRYWGGRGITICPEWSDRSNGRQAFVNWALSNGYAPNLSIDRIDVNGPYAPWNCRWATATEQANNTRKNVVIEIDGVKKTLSEWSRESGVNYDHLKYLKNTDLNRAIQTIKDNCKVLQKGDVHNV